MNQMRFLFWCSIGLAVAYLGLVEMGQAQIRNAAVLALTKRFDVSADHKSIPFKEALAVFSKLTGVAITIDAKSLKPGQKLSDIEDHPVRLPKLNAVLLAPILRHMTQQVGGSYLIRGQQLVVVLDRPDANAPTSAKSPLQQQLEAALQQQLVKKVTVAKMTGVSFDEAIYTLANKHKLNVLIDSEAFARAGTKKVEEVTLDLAAMKSATLATALQKVLEPVRGAYQVRDNVIWVEPSGKK